METKQEKIKIYQHKARHQCLLAIVPVVCFEKYAEANLQEEVATTIQQKNLRSLSAGLYLGYNILSCF